MPGRIKEISQGTYDQIIKMKGQDVYHSRVLEVSDLGRQELVPESVTGEGILGSPGIVRIKCQRYHGGLGPRCASQ